jgi:hydrogenase-1 operon protein HyaF
MALSVLAEIGRMLEALSESGQAGSIDLRSLPLSDADRAQLEEVLGRGEVRAELELAGNSEVWETRYPGVWWIRHRGAGDKIATEEISVCAVPEILITHPVDIKAAAGRLREELETTHV